MANKSKSKALEGKKKLIVTGTSFKNKAGKHQARVKSESLDGLTLGTSHKDALSKMFKMHTGK